MSRGTTCASSSSATRVSLQPRSSQRRTWRYRRGAALTEERTRDVVPLARHDLKLRGRLGEWEGDDVIAAQRGHLPELAVEREVCRLEPEASGQHAISRRGGAAALHVAEHRDARLETGALLDLASERIADAALGEDHVAELIRLSAVGKPG